MEDHRIIWIDLEAAGLDPQHSAILEIALVVTDWRGEEIAHWEAVVGYPRLAVSAFRSRADRHVQTMHDANGLWGECGSGQHLSLASVEYSATLFAQTWVEPASRRCRLGGRNVGSFDVQFLRAQMPDLAAALPFRAIDVTTVDAFARACGVELPRAEGGGHRALADLRRDIAWYRAAVASMRR